jgi:hypothetical protein
MPNTRPARGERSQDAGRRPREAPTTFEGPTAGRWGGKDDEAVARRTGNVTQRDDDFLARTEPFAEPRWGGLNQSSSAYAEGLRSTRAERRASRHDETRRVMRKAFVVGAVVMGAAVMAAATFTVLVFAGLFTSGVGGGDRPVTLEQQPPATTSPPPSPSDAADSTPPTETTATSPPSTTAQTGRPPQRSSNRVAAPRVTAGAQVPAPPPSDTSGFEQLAPSDTSGLEQLSSASAPPPSDAPAPATPITNPAGHAPPGRN